MPTTSPAASAWSCRSFPCGTSTSSPCTPTGWSRRLPVIRIPDSTLYLRAEINSLLCGGWEPQGLSTDPREFTLAGKPPPIDPDWDVLGWFAEQLAPEIPQVEQLGIRSVFKGWPTFTPDGRFIVGESSRVQGLRDGRRLQRPRRLRLGRHRPARGRVDSRTRSVAVREKPQPRSLRCEKTGTGSRPAVRLSITTKRTTISDISH